MLAVSSRSFDSGNPRKSAGFSCGILSQTARATKGKECVVGRGVGEGQGCGKQQETRIDYLMGRCHVPDVPCGSQCRGFWNRQALNTGKTFFVLPPDPVYFYLIYNFGKLLVEWRRSFSVKILIVEAPCRSSILAKSDVFIFLKLTTSIS